MENPQPAVATTEPVVMAVNMNVLDLFPANHSNQWPILKDMWSFFAGNAGNINILTVSSKDVLPDLKLAEKVGGKLSVCVVDDESAAYWEDIKSILKERTKSPLLNNKPEYSTFAKCWVLSNRVSVVKGLPSIYNGSVQLSETNTVPLVSIDSLTPDGYFDIVKIDSPGIERYVVNQLTEYGMRPSLILINWEHDPDEDLKTHASAATLVNHGYSFLARVDNKYIYHYNDKAFYNLCHYSKPNHKNPMVESSVNFAKNAVYKQLGKFLGLVNEQSSEQPPQTSG